MNTQHISTTPSSSNTNGGFSIVELIYVMSIVSLLGAISVVSYMEYKEETEYTKAASTMRSARIALEVGEQDVGSAFGIGFTDSPTTGGPVPAVLQQILPGMVTDSDVELTILYSACPDATLPDVNAVLVSKNCKAPLFTSWMRLCNGIEIENRRQRVAAPLC